MDFSLPENRVVTACDRAGSYTQGYSRSIAPLNQEDSSLCLQAGSGPSGGEGNGLFATRRRTAMTSCASGPSSCRAATSSRIASPRPRWRKTCRVRAAPGPRSDALRRWSRGGVGLIISGNVMIDARAMTGAAGVVLDSAQPLAPFTEWAKAAHAGGGRAWLQINHPGRQTPTALGQAVAPSACRFGSHDHEGRFPIRALREEIFDLIDKFRDTTQLVEKAGFSGVQDPCGAGYLISQFASTAGQSTRGADWGSSPARPTGRLSSSRWCTRGPRARPEAITWA